MIKINCKKYADEIMEQVRQIKDKRKGLLILSAGSDPASEAYVKGKIKDCERCGIPYEYHNVKSWDELDSHIYRGNYIGDVGGTIVDLPLPEGWTLPRIRREKDVDGLMDDSEFLPCTPEAILYVLEKELGKLAGKSILLIGRGKLVGKPLIELLLNNGCTLTVAHSKTEESELWRQLNIHHDAVISAVGKPNLIDLKEVNADVVIDAGISRNDFGKLCGDCYGFDEGAIHRGINVKVTTVPNGIGLLTRAMLMKHMGDVNNGTV